MTEHIVGSQLTEDERGIETTLRPQTLEEYVGQVRMKESLRICIEAAKQRGEALDHAIFYGPPGPRQDDDRTYYRARNGRIDPLDLWAGVGACRRSCGHSNESPRRRCIVH